MSSPSLITELEDQFAQNPRRVFARLANEYRKSGDVDRAIEICRAHVPQQPGYISGYIVLGQALYEAGQLEESRQTFETALTLDPENLIALRQLGDIARDQLDLDQARAWYRRLLEVDPQNEEVAQQLDSLFTSSSNASASSSDHARADEPAPDASAGSFFSFAEIGPSSDAPASDVSEPPSDRGDGAVVLPLRATGEADGEPDGHMVELTSSTSPAVTPPPPPPPP
ncbi:MAG: tetratricopeptide repeat protein, partial [Gemmatimonadota bacterium]|nr:tetratricopeptide repeat protein [Gemmatimonadota bacterium]